MNAQARLLVLILTMLGLLVAVVVMRISDAPPAREFADGHVATVHVFDTEGELVGPVAMAPVEKTRGEWREILTSDQYHVVREAGTELPGTGAFLDNKDDGVYTCVACRLPLFTSTPKFESGTGWPSFYEPIASDNVGQHSDRSLGMVRSEITCARCNGHLGHVFGDGPRPTGLRYCLNSAALSFTPTADIRSLAELAAGDAAAGSTPSQATAVIAGGCFWCVEAIFEEIKGVRVARSGYAGGKASTARYALVTGGRTEHAEAVQLIYDPSVISYDELLRIHLATHDPTTLDRQGADVGPQYRSAIFYAGDQQRATAQAVIDELTAEQAYGAIIVTTLEPLEEFFPAEAYHQDYVRLNPGDGYVKAVALPKVRKVRKLFPARLKSRVP